MQSIAIPWLLVWGLLSAGFVLSGLAVLLKGLYPKPIGTAPHCPKCGYNLTGSVSQICPECGAARRETICRGCGLEFGDSAAEVCPHCGGPRVMDTAVCGEYRRRLGLIITAAILVLLGFTCGVGTYRAIPQATARGYHPRSLTLSVLNARLLVADLRRDSAAGRLNLATPTASGQARLADQRMAILAMLIQEKIPYLIRRGGCSPAVGAAALPQVSTIARFIQEQLVPAYDQARRSGKPEDAKALVPLVDRLGKQLDALRKTDEGD